MSKRQQRTIGAIVSVPIENYSVHAQVLADTDMVFFDSRNKADQPLADILSSNVLFRVGVNSDAILDGRWIKVGKAEISQEHLIPVSRFIQNALNPEKFEIYTGGTTRSASKDECKNLDRCAVWAVNHIEDRIRDHYNGVENVWVEQMRLK
jgi:hypothetical protein